MLLSMIAVAYLLSPAAQGEVLSEDVAFRVLEHVDAQAGMEDICCNDGGDHLLDEPPSSHFSTRYGGGPYWIKLEGVTGGGLIQFQPVLDRITLYTRSKGSPEWQKSETGDTLANSVKPLATPFMALPLPDDVDQTAIFARIEQPDMLTIKAKHWSMPSFAAMQETDRVVKIFLLGFVSAIIVYNLVVSFLARDAAFALNALSIACLLILTLYLSGYGVTYVWAPWFAFTNVIMNFALFFGILFGGTFIFTFLKNNEETYLDYWPVLLQPALAILSALILFFAGAPYWSYQMVFLAAALLLFLGITWLAAKKAISGDPKARILLVPLSVALLPGVSFIALDKIWGMWPINLNNNGMEIALAIEAILFSLALASRIRLTETASREASLQLLQSHQRNATIALSAQDNERRRLAKELHDGVGQEVLVIVSSLKRLAQDRRAGTLAKRIREVAQMATEAMDTLRQISRAMHPASIEHLGLEGAVRETVDHSSAATEIVFDTRISMQGAAISHDRQLHIVRIVQECLSNVIRHSGATHCRIEIVRNGNTLLLSVVDDGVGPGFRNGNGTPEFGLGLVSVGERVRNLDGSWEMAAVEGGGTAVRIAVPLQPDQMAGSQP